MARDFKAPRSFVLLCDVRYFLLFCLPDTAAAIATAAILLLLGIIAAL